MGSNGKVMLTLHVQVTVDSDVADAFMNGDEKAVVEVSAIVQRKLAIGDYDTDDDEA